MCSRTNDPLLPFLSEVLLPALLLAVTAHAHLSGLSTWFGCFTSLPAEEAEIVPIVTRLGLLIRST